MPRKRNTLQLFPHAPAPRHTGTLPPSKSSSWRCRGTNFHPDWTKWRPSYAHLKFQISTFVQPPRKSMFWHSGIHRAEERKSPFFHFPLVSFSNRTKGWPPNRGASWAVLSNIFFSVWAKFQMGMNEVPFGPIGMKLCPPTPP